MMICEHQFNMINQQQGAIREYLQACIAFINLSLGGRLSIRNHCILQGFGFLYKYQQLLKSNQESNYNLVQAYHHVGLLQLGDNYYEKVLNMRRTTPFSHCLMRLRTFFWGLFLMKYQLAKTSCNLQREAAYNLHSIYKKSGALHLAGQVLKDHCRV